jgi:hypothetical protein
MSKRPLVRRRFPLGGELTLESRELLSGFRQSAPTSSFAVALDVQHLNDYQFVGGHEGKLELIKTGMIESTERAQAAVYPTVRRWSWLANTYWYVPRANLPAVLYDSATGTLMAVRDQTLFHITDYRNGYFWGESATMLDSSDPSYSTMLGSVTPEGRFLLTFTSTGNNGSASITEGFGTMRWKRGQWTMENQMFTAPTERLQIGHWAYMVQTRPGMSSWKSLPLAATSVPAFLNHE